ncbi:sugar phosphate isomerase/epimerase family protein [Paenibacillus yanchengensis]|uniref:Sugar phosphate isomerase/epimerase family protein n=1 Tax=Paenibacillus yanchengensis TaxID=2035833 RepID=A0ABW4YIJ1_9BACL
MSKMLYSLFPKFFQKCSVEQLANIAVECGFDAVDLMIRDQYWVTTEQLVTEAPAFVAAMQRKQLQVEFATTAYTPTMLINDETPLKVMSDIGIRSFRMAYFVYDQHQPLFAQVEQARREMQQLAELCEKYNIKAVYHIHHGDQMLIHHSYAALALVDGLPSQYIGVMPDPGNQFFEGSDNWPRAFATLGNYLAAIGIKDGRYRWDETATSTESKGWSKHWAPCQEGVTNWHHIAEHLHKVHFDGVLNFQPFYHDSNLNLLIPTLQQEVAYMREAMTTKR